jgi:hypothetical protein
MSWDGAEHYLPDIERAACNGKNQYSSGNFCEGLTRQDTISSSLDVGQISSSGCTVERAHTIDDSSQVPQFPNIIIGWCTGGTDFRKNFPSETR